MRTIRGMNVLIDLRRPLDNISEDLLDVYHLAIEVVPAWHDDVIGRTAAVGLKFHLYEEIDVTIGTNPDEASIGKKPVKVGVVGYTGDTAAYGLTPRLEASAASHDPEPLRIDRQFSDCDILIAHLGDVRFRELSTLMCWSKNPEGHPLIILLKGHFFGFGSNIPEWTKANASDFREKAHEFIDFMIALDILPSNILREDVPFGVHEKKKVQQILSEYLWGEKNSFSFPDVSEKMWIELVHDIIPQTDQNRKEIISYFTMAVLGSFEKLKEPTMRNSF